MNIDNVISIVSQKKKNTAEQVNEMMIFFHGWNAAIDHILQILKGYKEHGN